MFLRWWRCHLIVQGLHHRHCSCHSHDSFLALNLENHHDHGNQSIYSNFPLFTVWGEVQQLLKHWCWKKGMSMTPSLIMFKTDLNDKEYTGSKIHENARFHRIGEDLSGNVKLEHSPQSAEFYMLSAVNDVTLNKLPKLPAKYQNARLLKLYNVAADHLSYFVMANGKSYQYGGKEKLHNVFCKAIEKAIKKYHEYLCLNF